MGSVILAGICAELDEGVFVLRQALPLAWQGPAAEEFAAKVERVARMLTGASNHLKSTVRLVQIHERHMEALAAAMGQGG